MSETKSSETLLKVENLVTYFYTSSGVVKAVDGITFDIKRGEVVGLVGESGSGKSVTCLSILRTVPRPGKITDGKILFKGSSLLEKSEAEMQKIRGKEISMIFQNPAFSLNPIYSIGEQLVEILCWHTGLNKEEAAERALKLLKAVRLSDPEKRFNQYPHELSGGMKQRVVIARALLCNPSLLLADEPTTNVDVTVQAQLLNLLKDLKKNFSMTILFVTHDMGIVAQLTNRVVVLYSGKVCEIADTETIFSRARHPYTEALISSVPRFDYKASQRQKLKVIEGSIPDPISPPSGCRFHPRCAYADAICKSKVPEPRELEPGHIVSCFHAEEINGRD
jgi:oligopeptide/dipeptide ABC transporter ATP-binding protein